MAIYLETLDHQQEAIEKIVSAMEGCRDFNETNERDFKYVYANPIIKLRSENVKKLAQQDSFSLGKNPILDIKMETGTGKTFVYTKTMYELYKNFGLNKFVLFVPSLAIKEGAKNFISADYAKTYFSDFYPNIKIDLSVINAGDFSTKKGRKTLPSELIDFLYGTRYRQGTIKCLLINDAMLNSKSMNIDYDQTLISSVSRPLDAIRATRPVVIIDEPHRFKRGSKAFQEIENLNPQLILRFGATFPEIEIGKGKKSVTKKDYSNLIYDLNAVESFNKGLVKAIDVFYPSGSESEKYKVKSVSNKKLILSKNSKEFEILAGESLPSDFEGGLTFEGGREKALSNGLKFDEEKKELDPEAFSILYQKIMISQALDQHFKKERENWVRENAGENPAKIKTLSLFFIDSISSYRKEDGWLKNTFENLLRKKLKDAISKETNTEYKDFLEYSLRNISECHGGYFAEDAPGKNNDEKIQNEVDDILRNKNRLISFKDEKGKWILRRFLFSKWTLREGWDNPNVFVIAKIRSSGSEISKLQEVGRGLRLPVDENGRRLSEEEFRLSYIIDFSEKEFADKLIREINKDGGKIFEGKISDEVINILIKNNYAENPRQVRNKLAEEKIIDDYDIIVNSQKLQELLPNQGIQKDKIRNNPKKSAEKVKLRKDNWEKIKQLWLEVSQRYMIKFEELGEDEILEIAKKSIGENLRTSEIYSEKGSLVSDGKEIRSEVSRIDSGYTSEAIHYGDFLKGLSQNTNISPKIWHKAISLKHKAISLKKKNFEKECFNATSLTNIIRDFKKVFEEEFSQKFKYNKLDFTANTSLIHNGEFVEEISKSALGAFSSTEIEVDDRNLWNEICYDSVNPEMEISKIKPAEKVLVFGKIPQRAIRIPLFTGGTTSPDFIYAIKNDKNIEIDLFIEAKPKNLKESDKIATGGQEIFLSTVKMEWQKVTSAEEVESLLRDFSKE